MEQTLERAIVEMMTVTPFLENRSQTIETSASCKMLKLPDRVSGSRAEGPEELSCDFCSEKAEVFQVTGDYCLRCCRKRRIQMSNSTHVITIFGL